MKNIKVKTFYASWIGEDDEINDFMQSKEVIDVQTVIDSEDNLVTRVIYQADSNKKDKGNEK